jgi:hypothetical protein
MACPGGADPYAVLGVLIEEHIPKERRAAVAATLKQLPEERLAGCGRFRWRCSFAGSSQCLILSRHAAYLAAMTL